MTGSVTGHVYCADTNQPCRFASILLQPVSAADPAKVKNAPGNMGKIFSGTSGLDGSFTIEDVLPGTYDVVSDLPGYISGAEYFPPEEMRTASAELRQKLNKVLQKVTVDPNQTSTLTILMERGAAISGTVRYDDGSPAVNMAVHILRKQKDGNWKTAFLNATGPLSLWGLDTQTNDRGQYREAGLIPGIYTVETKLPIVQMSASGIFGNISLNVHPTPENALQVYLTNATQIHDAKALELGAGEERTDADIVIPVNGLHSLAGTVTAKYDGHAIGHGAIQLLDPTDKTVLRETSLHEDGTFAFNYVPEGSYLVQIDGLKDVSTGATVHIYGKVEQTLLVQGDMNAIVFIALEQGTAQTQVQR